MRFVKQENQVNINGQLVDTFLDTESEDNAIVLRTDLEALKENHELSSQNENPEVIALINDIQTSLLS